MKLTLALQSETILKSGCIRTCPEMPLEMHQITQPRVEILHLSFIIKPRSIYNILLICLCSEHKPEAGLLEQ